MAGKIEPLPGTGDIWYPEIREWHLLEEAARTVLPRYGYTELRTPIFERTEVFVRGIGDDTEVVQKEMYTFEDRGGRSLTLRPEGTASVMRAIANAGLNQGEEKRVFYMGPMFRGERPAAGRRRQFHQVGVEAVGRCAPGVDAECIAMLMDYLQAVGIRHGCLLLNSRGLPEDRVAVNEAMVNHFRPHAAEMCEDCRRRVATNVWRILDCKQESCQAIINAAPPVLSLLGESSRSFFTQVCEMLDALGIEYEICPRLVRGLDYYAHTVFEVTHEGLGAQDAIAGGGRYLVNLPGLSAPLAGVGYAVGMERLLMARASEGAQPPVDSGVDAYVIGLGDAALVAGAVLARDLRTEGFSVLASQESRSMKAQMRAANRCGARLALIRGDQELEQGVVMIKDLRASEQTSVPLTEAVQTVRRMLM